MSTQKIRIEVRNGDINKALSLFKKKVFSSGHLLELKERQQFEKPSEIKRKQKQKAKRINWLRIRDENTIY